MGPTHTHHTLFSKKSNSEKRLLLQKEALLNDERKSHQLTFISETPKFPGVCGLRERYSGLHLVGPRTRRTERWGEREQRPSPPGPPSKVDPGLPTPTTRPTPASGSVLVWDADTYHLLADVAYPGADTVWALVVVAGGLLVSGDGSGVVAVYDLDGPLPGGSPVSLPVFLGGGILGGGAVASRGQPRPSPRANSGDPNAFAAFHGNSPHMHIAKLLC